MEADLRICGKRKKEECKMEIKNSSKVCAVLSSESFLLFFCRLKSLLAYFIDEKFLDAERFAPDVDAVRLKRAACTYFFAFSCCSNLNFRTKLLQRINSSVGKTAESLSTPFKESTFPRALLHFRNE